METSEIIITVILLFAVTIWMCALIIIAILLVDSFIINLYGIYPLIFCFGNSPYEFCF